MTTLNDTTKPLVTQLSLFSEENDQLNRMTIDQIQFRVNSEQLREYGSCSKLSEEELRDLSASALYLNFKSLAGKEGATPLLRKQAQNVAVAKCMTGDMEGLFENVGISTDAFLDQVKKAFPPYGPHRDGEEKMAALRESLIRFAELVVTRFNSIKLEDERERLEKRAEKYDLYFF